MIAANCLEEWHACGDPDTYENPCADKINDFDCFCGNFTERAQPNNPCDDFRLPHKLHHENKCDGYHTVWGSRGSYSCTCDVECPTAVGAVAASYSSYSSTWSRGEI